MGGWHHWLNGHEFGWTLEVGDGQGGLACCSSWGRKELDTTERLNWSVCLIYWGGPMLGTYIFAIVISSYWIDSFIIMQYPSLLLPIVFVSKSILSDISIDTPAFFWVQFTWNIFFHSFNFSLCVALDLMSVSYKQIYMSLIFVYIQTVYIFSGVFNPLMFKVIINMYVLNAILLFWIHFHRFFLALSLLLPSLVIWWLTLMLCLDCFYFFV